MLRGLALFGILVVNLEFIASPPFEGWYAFDDPLDQAGEDQEPLQIVDRRRESG